MTDYTKRLSEKRVSDLFPKTTKRRKDRLSSFVNALLELREERKKQGLICENGSFYATNTDINEKMNQYYNAPNLSMVRDIMKDIPVFEYDKGNFLVFDNILFDE